MKGSLRVFTVRGIPIRVHWSFTLLLGLVVLTSGRHGSVALSGLLWVVAIFGSVTIHELSHSLVARRRGLTVRDIVLLPIGGVSEIEGLPGSPQDELVIALVGPLANIVIAGVLVGIGAAVHVQMWPPTLFARAWIARLLWANVLLAGFNLLPALPMDGGRALRAALARTRPEPGATFVATRLARALAVMMVILGFYYDFWFVVIGLFVFVGAAGEERMAKQRAVIGDVRVGDLMVMVDAVIESGEPASEAMAKFTYAPHKAIPVVSDGQYLGIVNRDELAAAPPDNATGDVADRGAKLLEPSTEILPTVFEEFARSHRRELAVGVSGVPVGVLYATDVEARIRSATGGRASPGPRRTR